MIFGILFAIEALMKIIAFGLIFHPEAYLKSPLNVLDFSLAIIG